ncbi:MAG: alpha-amylase family glycosyl hydrolase [Rhodothermaceae bacterium]
MQILRPHLKKLLSLFCILPLLWACGNKAKTETETTHKEIKPVEWSKNSIIYEVNLRQYSEAGTFAEFEKKLPELKAMGVDILWFMPIHPIGEKNRKGTMGSYYAVKDYKAVNPEHGTLEEFKALVKKIHSMDMKVIIDWVANHTAWDNIWVESNPEFFNKNEKGEFFPPVDGWQDVIDLNYENKELWTAMTDALKFWVKEADIDGYRCDVAAMVPLEFWQQARVELDKIKPVFMLAEAHEAEMHHDAFDMTYSWQLKDLMNAVAKGEKNALDIKKHFENEKTEYKPEAYRMLFTTNHDENTWNGTVFERLGDGAEMFSVLCGTAEGMLLVYSGQEAGNEKRIEFFEKDPIKWKEHKFRGLFTKLANLKENNKALWNGTYGAEMVHPTNDNDKNVYSFVREKENNKIFSIFNVTGKKQHVAFTDKVIAGKYKDLITGEEVEIKENQKFELKPWAYLVYVK